MDVDRMVTIDSCASLKQSQISRKGTEFVRTVPPKGDDLFEKKISVYMNDASFLVVDAGIGARIFTSSIKAER